ncbi:hypothetical protein LZ30DRAFT_725606 [Colletotrichum cereale]|nr:hypothetical protein LZ30DRAFT_725606 [Colletotrichum cereale]
MGLVRVLASLSVKVVAGSTYLGAPCPSLLLAAQRQGAAWLALKVVRVGNLQREIESCARLCRREIRVPIVSYIKRTREMLTWTNHASNIRGFVPRVSCLRGIRRTYRSVATVQLCGTASIRVPVHVSRMGIRDHSPGFKQNTPH